MPVYRARVLSPTTPESVLWWPDAVVDVDDTGRIREVARYDGRPVDEHLDRGVLTPAFVDGHVHFPQSRIVGSASGPLLDWLAHSTFPEEARFADDDHAAHVADVFAAALAAAGTTLALAYGPVFPAAADAMFGAAERRGLRMIGGPVLMDEDCPPELRLPADRAIPALEALADRWHGRDGRLQVAVIPRFALSCSADLLRAAGDLASRRGLWSSTHLSENRTEVKVATERWKSTDYLAIYEGFGLVNDRSVYAHCIHLSQGEWDRIAAAGAVVAHCPDSNAFLGSGNFSAFEARQRDVPVVYGTDVAAGRSFRVNRTASYAYDTSLAVGHPVSPARLLWNATRGGALALQVPEIGMLQAGLEADMVWHDLPGWVDTCEQALSWLLFDADAPRPRRTWARGRVVWEREHAGYPWESADALKSARQNPTPGQPPQGRER